MTTLEKKIVEQRRKRVLQKRLRSVLLRYFDHEDAGLKDKHERIVLLLRTAIKKLK